MRQDEGGKEASFTRVLKLWEKLPWCKQGVERATNGGCVMSSNSHHTYAIPISDPTMGNETIHRRCKGSNGLFRWEALTPKLAQGRRRGWWGTGVCLLVVRCSPLTSENTAQSKSSRELQEREREVKAPGNSMKKSRKDKRKWECVGGCDC